VPPKPLHPVFHILLLTAIAVGIVALFGLEFKYHLFVDLMVVAWILTLNFSEIITFTFLNIIVGLLSVLVAIGFEVLWFLFYRRVCSSELGSSVYVDDGSLLGFRRYTYWISIVGIAVKSVLFLILLLGLFLIERKPAYVDPSNIGARV